MTEYHQRYGGAGVMIYWHVERDSVCIYSQLKTCSSSEVAAMIEGLLRHCTTAQIEANYTDTHGASIIGFAFCELLGFRLLPRLKRIGAIRLYRPDDTPARWKPLERVLTRPIRWELIARQYDQLVKYATALRLGTAEAEQVLRRFTRGGQAPDLPGAGGARPRGPHDLRVRVPRLTRAAARDPHRPAGRGDLEFRQRRGLLRQELRARRPRPRERGDLDARVAPAAVRRRARQHPAAPAGPRRTRMGEPDDRG
jgi:Tn3 transposase DDE domain-containing protein